MTKRWIFNDRLVFGAVALGAGLAAAAPHFAAAAPLRQPVRPGEDYSAAYEAQALVQQELFLFRSVHAVGIGNCEKWWAHTLLGKDIPPEAPHPQIGISVSFSDPVELETFARSSLIFGSYIPTSKGDVLLCADLRAPATPQPVSGGSSQ